MSQRVYIEGNLKLGNFAVSFTDLTIPVAGIPLTVTRVYDTLDAGRDRGVGFGWRLAFDPELQVELPPGTGVGWGRYPPFTDGTRVFLTLPGGPRQGFTFRTYEERQVFGHLVYWRPYFEADAGNFTQLSVPEVLLAKADNGEYYTMEPSGLVSYNPADPVYGGTYTLTTQDGVAYRIAADGGQLLDATDRNGNRLTYTEEAITSNRGVAVTFERDAAGRITAVVDPRGNAVRYAYNAAGDLVAVTDRLGTVVARYSYRADRPHYLETITEADGVRAVEARYNAQGRLDRLMDADGNPVDLAYDVANLTVTATQPGIQPTVTTLDERGNVVRQEDGEGGVTLTSYVNDLPTAVTRVVGAEGGGDDLTSTFTYDVTGNPLTATDPTGAATRMTYNVLGLPATMSDPLGNTVHNQYDERGNLLATTSPTGVLTEFTYDERGNLRTATTGGATSDTDYTAMGQVAQTTDAAGVSRTFSYDANGNATGTTFTWVNPANPQEQRLVETVTIYDANDQAVLALDAQGNTTRTQYDRQGRAVRRVDVFGEATETLHDRRGLVIQTRNPDGTLVRTTYDSRGQVELVTDPYVEGQAEVFGTRTFYDDAGRVTRTERRKGVVVAINGTAPSLTSSVASFGTQVWFEETQYDTLGRLETGTDRYGLVTENTYNRVGQLVQVRTQARDENDTLVWLVQRTVFDAHGRVSVATDPAIEGSTAEVAGTRTIYDDLGRAVRSERLHGVVVGLVSGNTVVTDPGTVVSTTRTVYNTQGPVAQTIDAANQATDYEYDDRGRQKAVITPAITDPVSGVLVRHRAEVEYDAYGQVRFERTNIRQYPGGTIDRTDARVTVHDYDAFGNRVQTTFADNSTLAWGYDAFGQQASATDQLNNTRGFEYTDGRLTAVELPEVPDPLNNNALTRPRYEYEYDDFGNLEVIRDPLDHETHFTNTPDGRQLTRTLPLGQQEEFRNDDFQRQALHISFEGVVTAFIYNVSGQLAEKRCYPSLAVYANGTGTPEVVIAYVYDAFGRKVQEDDSSRGITEWFYDIEGRFTRIASPEGAVNYRYDNYGRMTRMFTGDEAAPVNDIRYSYDARGLLATVTVWVRERVALPEASREVTRYEYDLVGNLAKTVLPNGITSVYEHDALNRLTQLTQYAPDQTPATLADNPKLVQFVYALLPDGKWDGVTETHWVNGTAQVIVVDWTYDAAGRLTEEDFDHYDNSLDFTADYVMDLVGNRLEKRVDRGRDGTIDEVFASGYDANDRLLTEALDLLTGTDTTTTYSYGGAGNPATMATAKEVRDTATSNLVQTVTYTYNLDGRLAEAVTETYEGGNVVHRETVAYTYDDTGIRTAATATVEVDDDQNPGTPLAVESEIQTTYLNDPQNPTGYSQVVEETVRDVATGNVLTRVVTTVGLDVIAQTTFTPGGPAEGETRVLLYDGHGSTRLLTDLAGLVEQVYSYDAYGIPVGFDPALALTTLLHDGEQLDQWVHMGYHRDRYYQAWVGLWDRMDRYAGDLNNPQSLHKILFVHADPVNSFDPTGQFSLGLGGFAIGLLGRVTTTGVVLSSINFAITVGLGVRDNKPWSEIMLEFALSETIGFGVGSILRGAGKLAARTKAYQAAVAAVKSRLTAAVLETATGRAMAARVLQYVTGQSEGAIERILGYVVFGTKEFADRQYNRVVTFLASEAELAGRWTPDGLRSLTRLLERFEAEAVESGARSITVRADQIINPELQSLVRNKLARFFQSRGWQFSTPGPQLEGLPMSFTISKSLPKGGCGFCRSWIQTCLTLILSRAGYYLASSKDVVDYDSIASPTPSGVRKPE